jgi:2-oxoglutarate dehydrogenase E1 component
VIEGEQWEKFLARKYVGTKRFGLDGGESMVPGARERDQIWRPVRRSRDRVRNGPRGRLNVLANVMAKPYRAIFSEFAGGSANPEDVGGSGDVKYHLGTSSDREFDGIKVHMSLVPNPSHLEAVDPVVLGKVRGAPGRARRSKAGARSCRCSCTATRPSRARGIVAECFGFSGIPGYGTGGTIHYRHQQPGGFTTSPHSPIVTLPVRHRQVGPGADPARQRRRSGSGDLRLQARHRISAEVRPRHRHRHVVLSPLRP